MTRRVVLAALVLGAAAAEPREPKRSGLLAPLEVGQRVRLFEKDHGYEIDVIPGLDAKEGCKVLEVSPDLVVLEDPAGDFEIRISICAVKAVKVFRAPKEKVKGAAGTRK